jgi:hypothetical protein
MDRRNVLPLSGLSAAGFAATAGSSAVSKWKQRPTEVRTEVRLVNPTPKHPLPACRISIDAWSTGGVEVASPMSIYPEYKAMRPLFQPDAGKLPGSR